MEIYMLIILTQMQLQLEIAHMVQNGGLEMDYTAIFPALFLVETL